MGLIKVTISLKQEKE